MNKIFIFMRESGPARFLIPVGLALIIFGVIVFVINSKNQNYVKIESNVKDVTIAEQEYIDNDGNHIEATYDVKVSYIVDDKEYIGELNGLGEYKVGDKITIYYNPSNPTQITQTKSLVLPIVMFIVGIISLVGGIISAKNSIRKYQKMKEQERRWANE